MISRIHEIWNYREMIKSLVRKDLRTRYKGSVLGFLWTFANPLLQLLVYATIFPFLMKVQEKNFAMFMFVALVPWNYFTSSLQGGCTVILMNTNLVTKIYFPREVLPISYAISGICNMIFSYMVVIPMLLIFRVALTPYALLLPLLFIMQFILCTGIILICSAVNVYFRDLEYILGIITMALYFFTPIMYNLSTLPEKLQGIVMLNPMAGYALAYRDIMYYGQVFNVGQLLYSFIVSVIILVVGFVVFDKLQRNFSEVL